MDQRSRQRDQILHDRPVAQLFDLDGLKVDTRCRELAGDSIDVRACRDENCDTSVCRLFQRVAHDGDHALGLDVFIGIDERVDVHVAAGVRDGRRARTVLNGALLRVVARSQHRGERRR